MQSFEHYLWPCSCYGSRVYSVKEGEYFKWLFWSHCSSLTKEVKPHSGLSLEVIHPSPVVAILWSDVKDVVICSPSSWEGNLWSFPNARFWSNLGTCLLCAFNSTANSDVGYSKSWLLVLHLQRRNMNQSLSIAEDRNIFICMSFPVLTSKEATEGVREREWVKKGCKTSPYYKIFLHASVF